MPTVPVYDGMKTSVAPESGTLLNSNRGPQLLQSPQGPQAGAIGADQLSQTGQALQSAGNAAARMAQEAADMANQVRVNDALNQARIAAQDLAYNKDTGYLNRKGASAFLDEQGAPLAQPLSEEYGSKLRSRIDELTASLGNDRQRQLFQMHANDLSTSFNGSIEQHMNQQFGVYSDKVDDSTAKLAAQNAVLNWNNPDVVFGKLDPSTGQRTGGAIDQAKAAIYAKAKRAGLVGAPYDEAVLAGVSAIHEQVILTALQNNNPQYALSYMEKARKAGEMAPNDILKVQGHVNLAVDSDLATKAVSTVVTDTVPKMAPTNFDRMTQITLSSESGGKRYGPDGKTLLTSPAGAKGEMQVMDGTNKNPGFGVTPAKDDSPDERARVGRDYLAAMVRKYGDPAQAWAAYNAGPGTLDSALKSVKTAQRTGSGSTNWLDYMPKETRAYVAKNVAVLGSGATPVKPPTELEFVNNAVAQLPAGASPQAVKLTTEAAKSKFSMITKAMADQGDNAVAQAQRWILDNKGASIESMPPQLRDDLTRYAPGKMDDVKAFASNISRNDVQTNQAVYLKLTDPTYLKSMSDNQFFVLRSQLSESDFKNFAGERQKLVTGAGGNGWGDLNTGAINDTIKSRIQAMGGDPSPKDGSAEAIQLGTVHKFVRDKLIAAQQTAGKKFSDAETSQFIDGLFAKNVEFRSTFAGFVSGTKQARPLLGTKFSDIPGPLVQAIKKDLQAKGKPTDDGTVLSAYLNLKN